jgi:hypothetical protein
MKSTQKVLHWMPRIIGIMAILFISLFALDAFAPGLSFWRQITGFFIHLIPSFVLTILLAVAWKWELAGGIVFTLIGILMSPIVFSHNYRMNESFWLSLGIISSITFPFIVVGLLFILNHYRKKAINRAG